MKSIVYIQFFILICFSTLLQGQVDRPTLPKDSIRADSSGVSDTIPRLRGIVAFSADTLEDLVDYSARDSIIFDNVNHLIYLYGEASIKYQTYSITADYILVDLDSSIALAEQLPDSLKKTDPLDQLRAEEEPEEEEEESAPVYSRAVRLHLPGFIKRPDSRRQVAAKAIGRTG